MLAVRRTIAPTLVIFLIAALLAVAPPAQAADFTVTKPADTADGTCDTDCSLREAIIAANAAGGADTISVPAETYNLTIASTNENAAANGDLDITDSVTITGAGAATTIVDAGDLDRVLHVLGGTVQVSGLTLRNGFGPFSGGGILAEGGTLNVTNSTITGNDTSGFMLAQGGGGLWSSVPVTLTGTTVSNNRSVGDAGGIYIGLVPAGTTLTLDNSVVTGNTAGADLGSGNCGGNGGGIWSNAGDTVTITNNSVISSNMAKKTAAPCEDPAQGNGGGIYNSGGSVTITNSTVGAGNIAEAQGGGIWTGGGGEGGPETLTVTDSTINGNDAATSGGGIYAVNDTLNVARSTISGNDALNGNGGGIWVTECCAISATLTNSTLSGNSAAGSDPLGRGGGLYVSSGSMSVDNSTVYTNTARAGGNLATSAPATISLTGSIVSNGTPQNCSIAGTLTSNGFNLTNETLAGDTCGFTDPTDLLGLAPGLGDLLNNGGPTLTHALQEGSPAIDAGPTNCPPPATDQRGVDRAQRTACDIGAFELASVPPPPPTVCSDSQDNDFDGKIDFGPGPNNDPGCASPDDNSELDPAPSPTPAGPECSDGTDNDQDGKTDFGTGPNNDPGCSALDDASESPDPEVPKCPGFEDDSRNQIVGTTSDERLLGTSGDDIICGLDGDDVLRGGAGDDLLIGNAGIDNLNGEGGDDTIRGGLGDDTAFGGPGLDTVGGGKNDDDLLGGAGNDIVRGRRGNDTVFGQGGDDTLQGHQDNDELNGGADTDDCTGGIGTDTFAHCE